MIIIYIILFLSIALNLLLFVYDFLPFIIKRYRLKKTKLIKKGYLEDLVLKASINISRERKLLMEWQEPDSFSEKLFNIFLIKTNPNIVYYNFPRAFMIFGLTEYLVQKDNKIELENLKIVFNEILDEKGKSKFLLEKVDQVTFGRTALSFYEYFKEDRYLKFADTIFDFLNETYELNNGLILYRNNTTIFYYDTLGMIIPFFVKYYGITKNEKAIEIAKSQMDFYINFGMDKDTFIPSHGINIITKTKIGSINWGRGIGWYLIGLEALYNFDGTYEKEYNGIIENLSSLKNKNGFWTQFPGSSENFDASATLMILSCFPKENLNIDEILKQLELFISSGGLVLNSSGDTYGANRYSETFGKSELSQGMLLYLLSKHQV